jgi:hypothetical protein
VTAKAHPRFWLFYNALPETVRRAADKQFAIWCQNPGHPSLNFKKVGHDLWSARVDRHYRALARWRNGGYVWFWIGTHDDYEQFLSATKR